MLEEIFEIAKNNPLCNTSYPLNKTTWIESKSIDVDLFSNEVDYCFYVHIPFCKSLCHFCEYIKFKKDIEKEKEYLKILRSDIEEFLKQHSIQKIYGFDIGGGTPTVLEIDCFKELMEIAKLINFHSAIIEDYVPSIEATFLTIDEEKIRCIHDAGFTRISLGVQTMNTKLLLDNDRDIVNVEKMSNILDMIREHGITTINLDLMYGIPHQTMEDIKNIIQIIKILNPSQVTLYEMRYNMVELNSNFTKEELYECYKYLYEQLIILGYHAHFGQNTFSKSDDLGLSSYLKYRMIENISYKGFGVAAQSKSKIGISYNIGKDAESFSECVKKGSFYPKDLYILSKEELLAKYIAVSLYYGQFKISIMDEILKTNALKYYEKEFDFLIQNKYITINDDIVRLTELGFKYFGAVGSLFYSAKTKRMLLGD